MLGLPVLGPSPFVSVTTLVTGPGFLAFLPSAHDNMTPLSIDSLPKDILRNTIPSNPFTINTFLYGHTIMNLRTRDAIEKAPNMRNNNILLAVTQAKEKRQPQHNITLSCSENVLPHKAPKLAKDIPRVKGNIMRRSRNPLLLQVFLEIIP